MLGDNIDTDQIYPGRYLELTEYQEIAEHAMEGVDPSFTKKVKVGDIIMAGKNFGCGSSREHAVIALKYSGISAVLAQSFARIFYRNALNLGLPLIEISNLKEQDIKEGDIIQIDIQKGEVTLNNNKRLKFLPFPEHILKIIEAGGVINMYKKRKEVIFGDKIKN